MFAKWNDGFYYPAKVNCIKLQHCKIKFCDGNKKNVKLYDIFICDHLPLGQNCLAKKVRKCISDSKNKLASNRYVLLKTNFVIIFGNADRIILAFALLKACRSTTSTQDYLRTREIFMKCDRSFNGTIRGS